MSVRYEKGGVTFRLFAFKEGAQRLIDSYVTAHKFKPVFIEDGGGWVVEDLNGGVQDEHGLLSYSMKAILFRDDEAYVCSNSGGREAYRRINRLRTVLDENR